MPGLEMEDVIDDGLEEGAIVAHHHHGRVELAQVILQPAGGLEIEVIGGLVEQEQVGRRHQLAHQPQASALAAAQALERAATRLVGIEAQAVQHRVDPGGHGVAVLPLETLEVAVVARQRLLGDAVARLGQRGGLLRQRALELEDGGGTDRPPPPTPWRRRRSPVAGP